MGSAQLDAIWGVRPDNACSVGAHNRKKHLLNARNLANSNYSLKALPTRHLGGPGFS